MAEQQTVDFWFDPSCPYTWVTSRWLVELARVRPVEVCWRVMSLSVLNEGRDDDPEGDPDGYLWVPVRICAAVQREYGHAALGRLYAAMWSRRHGATGWLADLTRALEGAGLPRRLVEAGSSTDHDAYLHASHTEGVTLVGPHVGTPIIATTDGRGDRVAFFGPVLSQVPTGERAADLWDATLLVAGTPGFHELKGNPHAEPDVSAP